MTSAAPQKRGRPRKVFVSSNVNVKREAERIAQLVRDTPGVGLVAEPPPIIRLTVRQAAERAGLSERTIQEGMQVYRLSNKQLGLQHWRTAPYPRGRVHTSAAAVDDWRARRPEEYEAAAELLAGARPQNAKRRQKQLEAAKRRREQEKASEDGSA